MNQLGLPFSLNSRMLLRNFIGEKNKQILNFINNLFSQQDSCVVYIQGDESTGKTHLLQGIAFESLSRDLNIVYIDAKQDLPDGVISGFDTLDWVCIDNIACLSDTQQQELFDLYNRIKQTSTKLVVSGVCFPGDLDMLKDLKTRLSLAFVFSLEALDDNSKAVILEGKMLDKNIKIDSKIYAYLFKHYSRNLTDILSAINKLDESSLQQKQNITIPLIKQVLSID